jgi:hypothetical protein
MGTDVGQAGSDVGGAILEPLTPRQPVAPVPTGWPYGSWNRSVVASVVEFVARVSVPSWFPVR